jgi:hypothetical protein
MIATLICIFGIALILSEIVFRIYLKGRTRLIEPEDENRVLYFFIAGNIGLWMFLLAAGYYMIEDLSLDIKWFIPVGLIPGLISAYRNFRFWAVSGSKYHRKPALGEPAGGMAVGCFALVVMPLIGLAAGYVIYRLLL